MREPDKKYKPDIKYNHRKDNSLRPSWSDNGDYIHEHKAIFNKTKDIPGWQMEGDTFKLYEMSHHAGDVILEIGTYGGRSAVVEILGALSRPVAPQFYGVDVDTNSIKLTYETLKQFNLSDHALLYRGSLDKFISDFPIQPTMCFVDGDHRYEGVKKDLVLLSSFLRPGVPVLCHDYLNPENDTGDYGVRKAATEWEADGYAEFYGVFGCAALFVTTDKCSGRRGRLSTDSFKSRRNELLVSYGLEENTDNSITQNGHPNYLTSLLDHLSWRLRQLARKIVKLAGSHVKVIDKKMADQERYTYLANDTMPKWLADLPVEEGFPLISCPARFAHDETKYDEQYSNAPADLSTGLGLVNLLKDQNADFSGTVLEIGCGTGVLSLGLVSSDAFPGFIVTDPSTAFLDITYNKMRQANIDSANVHLAVLKAEEIDRLPKNEFSLIALRSTLHHVLHVDKFIHDAALALKTGGRLVFQEPCAEGYILMGAIAQFIPIILKQAGVRLSERHKNLIKIFIDTMEFYSRKDIDKSGGEDKHLFRVDEIMKTCVSAGLSSDFYPNRTFEYFSLPDHQRVTGHSFYSFFYNYLKYCMSFDQPLMDLIEKHFRHYCTKIDSIAPLNDPYMHGVFVCHKNKD